ncbi:MAG: ABC transporter permease [Exilibacterium sp.]
MQNTVLSLSLTDLTIALIPVLLVVGILFKWSLSAHHAIYAIARMATQLLLIGYLLTYIFHSDSAAIVLAILAVMVFASSWIALSTLQAKRMALYKYALAAVAVGGGVSLITATQGVLNLDPWYRPQYMVPLAGMIFANAMNSVSLAAERFAAEVERGCDYPQARNTALQAALIPITNTLFAAGLVSFPGMMTGQILSGISPLVAVRYQVMIMCMAFASSGISAACFLVWGKGVFLRQR